MLHPTGEAASWGADWLFRTYTVFGKPYMRERLMMIRQTVVDPPARRLALSTGRSVMPGRLHLLMMLATGMLAACNSESPPSNDAARGKAAIVRYGCPSCHTIPGVPGARGVVGPPLDGIARRAYLGGVLPNTPEDMVFWLRFPQLADPRTAMPDMGVTERDAHDIAAYLRSLH